MLSHIDDVPLPRYLSFHTGSVPALPNAPEGYAPVSVDCPAESPFIRLADGLSTIEKEWLRSRRTQSVNAMYDLLPRFNITGFNATEYIHRHLTNESVLPNIGIAISGGGYRALLSGAGALAAFDARTEGSTAPTHLGGIFQSSTYVSGLSGGAWLLGSLYINNITTVSALLDSSSETSVWDFNRSILIGPTTTTTTKYYEDLLDATRSKRDAGFDVSITDPWGRALSYQLVDGIDGGIARTWSSLALHPEFLSGSMPMPIITAVERPPGNRKQLSSYDSTAFEFNPWELGSFDPTTSGFAPLQFIGSRFIAGSLPRDERCVRGFDNAGFVMGTSSSIFNQVLIEIQDFSTNNSVLRNLSTTLASILSNVSAANLDIALYSPNPFYLFNNRTNLNSDSTELHLVDAALDLQNLPLAPLLVPARNVTVILALDNSADTQTNWPNGAALVAAYERYLDPNGIGNGIAFPSIPDINTFVNLRLNARPTFFGCNSSNSTRPTPLIVYLPNGPYTWLSNVSTFELTYNRSTRNGIVQNGYHLATLANATLDSSWPTCIGCAILSRSFETTGTEVPYECQKCFRKFCWDGTINATEPAPYQPNLAIVPETSAVSSGAATASLRSTIVILVMVVEVMLRLLDL